MSLLGDGGCSPFSSRQPDFGEGNKGKEDGSEGVDLRPVQVNGVPRCSKWGLLAETIPEDCAVVDIGLSLPQGKNAVYVSREVEEINGDETWCCGRMKNIMFESRSQLSRLGSGLFKKTGVESLVLPAGLMDVDSSVFCHSNIKWMAVECGNTSLSTHGSLLLGGGGKKIVWCFGDCVTIPETVEEIGPKAFDNCQIRELVVPKSVAVVAENSFTGCHRMRKLVFKNRDLVGKYFGYGNHNGIFKTLTEDCGGNPGVKGVIGMTASSTMGDIKYALDLYTQNAGLSYNAPGQWFTLDCKSATIAPTAYTVSCEDRCRYKSWIVSVSDDCENWTEIDRRENNFDLRNAEGMATFEVSLVYPGRFLRFKLISLHAGCSFNSLHLKRFEIFGVWSDESRVLERQFTSNPLDGLVAVLSKECGGNIAGHGIVSITLKDEDIYDIFDTEIYPDGSYGFYRSKDMPMQWVCFDLKTRLVKPTHYVLYPESTSIVPRSWILEGSIDWTHWVKIDEVSGYAPSWRANDGWHFTLSTSREFRFIRLTQTGKNWDGTDQLAIRTFEIFGNMIE